MRQWLKDVLQSLKYFLMKCLLPDLGVTVFESRIGSLTRMADLAVRSLDQQYCLELD